MGHGAPPSGRRRERRSQEVPQVVNMTGAVWSMRVGPLLLDVLSELGEYVSSGGHVAVGDPVAQLAIERDRCFR